MSEMLGKRREKIKELIRRLHRGEDPKKVKAQFKEVIKGVSAEEISLVEQELINEGIPPWEIQKLCEIHLQVFRESLKEETSLPPNHPIAILMEEHKILLQKAEQLKSLSESLKTSDNFDRLFSTIQEIKESENHYLREENVLFPYIEKHGVTQPPQIMWMEHDQIRTIKKELFSIVEDKNFKNSEELRGKFLATVSRLFDTLTSHFFKENNILFPTALKLITSDEWEKIKKGFDEIGYTYHHKIQKMEKIEADREKPFADGFIKFPTGELKIEELKAILNTLPIDITFIDKDDTVKYFNDVPDRIFIRTEAIIGRKVQLCHPQKSVHIVNKILDEFKTGKRNVAEFWIDFQGKYVYIRYFPVRDEKGNYLGCIEVTQDITHIKEIEGEKRLLD